MPVACAIPTPVICVGDRMAYRGFPTSASTPEEFGLAATRVGTSAAGKATRCVRFTGAHIRVVPRVDGSSARGASRPAHGRIGRSGRGESARRNIGRAVVVRVARELRESVPASSGSARRPPEEPEEPEEPERRSLPARWRADGRRGGSPDVSAGAVVGRRLRGVFAWQAFGDPPLPVRCDPGEAVGEQVARVRRGHLALVRLRHPSDVAPGVPCGAPTRPP